MRVHREAASPSSSTFFACIFRLLGAVDSFCACMSAVCVFPSAPLALCVVAIVADCNMPQCGERERWSDAVAIPAVSRRSDRGANGRGMNSRECLQPGDGFRCRLPACSAACGLDGGRWLSLNSHVLANGLGCVSQQPTAIEQRNGRKNGRGRLSMRRRGFGGGEHDAPGQSRVEGAVWWSQAKIFRV